MSLNFTNIEALIQTRLNALTVNVTAASASGTKLLTQQAIALLLVS